MKVKGFNLVRWDRSWSEGEKGESVKKGGGLICYIRENIAFSEDRYSSLNCSTRDLEMQWISLEIKNMRRVVVVNIYRPPQGDYKKACKMLNEAIGKADLKHNAELFLMGDFNINWKG